MSLDCVDAVLQRFDMERTLFWEHEVCLAMYAAAEQESLSDEERAVLSAEAAVWEFHTLGRVKSFWGTYYGPSQQATDGNGAKLFTPTLARWVSRHCSFGKGGWVTSRILPWSLGMRMFYGIFHGP